MNNLPKNLQYGLQLWLNEQGKDVSGNGNNGTLVNSPTVTRRSSSKGLTYNGSNQYCNIFSNLNIDGGPCTLSCFVRLNAEITSGNYGIIGTQSSNSDVIQEIVYQYNSGTIRLSFNRVRSYIVAETALYNISLGTNKTYHLAYTYDGTYIRGYVNLKLVSGPTSASGLGLGPISNSTSIGCYADSTGGFTNGSIINPMIWNRALSPTEIEQLYYGTFIK